LCWVTFQIIPFFPGKITISTSMSIDEYGFKYLNHVKSPFWLEDISHIPNTNFGSIPIHENSNPNLSLL
jgi:hypothetical protein